MSKQKESIRRFVLPVLLSVLMLFTGMGSPSFAAAPGGATKAASLEEKDPSETITLLVALKERKREERTGIRSVDVEDLNTRENIRAQVAYARAARETFYKKLQAKKISYRVVETYDVAYTGLAMEVKRKDVSAIQGIDEVGSVEISQPFKAPEKPIAPRSSHGRLDTSSNGMVQAEKAWKKNYAGKGSVIAVIDSGVDPYHEAMKLSDSNSGRMKSAAEVKKTIDELDVARGEYFNSKIPFGYNYANKSTSIKEFDPMSHGMHVSGIVAGNSKKIQGVAPEAQIVFMRVFGGGVFGNGTSAEIYTKAIDDAIKLGVDSMNISIGSPAGTEDYVFPNTVRALENAKKAGILVAIAAGNNGFFGYSPGADTKPKAENPDIGMLADPSVSPNSLSVASVQNVQVAKKGIQIQGDDRVLSFQPTTVGKVSADWVSLKDCGWGRAQDFKEKGDAATYALIERGEPAPASETPISFSDKINNARDNGYAGVIIYDNEPDAPLIQVEAPGTTIPAAFINRKDGLYLKGRLEAKVRFNDAYIFSNQENGGQPSEFSSWGLTPNGNLKPDIAAPGGGILSSLNDNQYGVMDGTSMAAPHVAGGVALIKQRVEKDFPTYRGEAKYDLIKKLLMSTAEPYKYKDSGAYASPRQQGAGLMQVDKAITATAYIEGSHGLTSINLGKALSGDTVAVPFKIVNIGKEAKTYSYYGVLNTDKVEDGKIVLRPRKISESAKQTVTVQPNEAKELTVTLPVTEKESLQKAMKNGFFLEGFIFCEEQNGVNLSAPFVGFHGSFDTLEVAEKDLYDLVAENKRSYYYDRGGKDDYYGTNIGGEIEKNLIVLGAQAKSTKEHPIFDKEKIAFSPNGDGRADRAIFMATFLRNFGGVEIAVTDRENKQVYYSNNPEDHGVKNFFVDPRTGNMFAANMMTTKPHWQWNGHDLSNKPMPDGKYKMTVKVAPAGKKIDASSQVLEFPIILDRVFPRVTKAYFNDDKTIYTIETIEEMGSGILSVLLKKGKEQLEPKVVDGKYVFDVSGMNLAEYEVEITDQARNDTRFPLQSGVRNGNERALRVVALAGNEPVPNEAFNWTVQSLDGKLEDPNNLSVGKHRLVVQVNDGNYKLIGDKVQEFVIEEKDRTKELTLRFETVETTEVLLNLNNPDGINVSLLIKNKDLQDQEYTPSVVNPGLQKINLPLGNYTIDVRGIQEGYYAKVDGGEDFSIQSRALVNKSIQVQKILDKDMTVKLNRKGYQGPLRLKLTGQDVYRTVQYVEFEAGQSEKKVRLSLIPSTVDLLDMEDGYYGLSSRAKTWTATRSANIWKVDLKALEEKDPNYVDKTKLRALVAKAREALANKGEYETADQEDQRHWQYIDLYLPMAEQILMKDDTTQDEVDKVYNNLNEGLSKLRKLGESKYDQSKLEAAIARAEALSKDAYTEKTWEDVEDALKSAKEMLKKPDHAKNQDMIDIVADDLNDALDRLVRRDEKALVDKRILEEALAAYRSAQYDEGDYTAESYQRLQLAAEKAEAIFNRPFPSQEEVNGAAKMLKDAMENLRTITGKKERAAEREALRGEIEEARQRNESDYTPASWLQLKEAIALADAIANKADAGLDSLQYARRLLKNAVDRLEKASDEKAAKTEVFELPFKALHANKDQESMAAGVFESPAKVIKTTDKEGKVNYRVVLTCRTLHIGAIEGHLKDIEFASGDEEGKTDTMALYDKVHDDAGDLTSITLDMGDNLRPIHFVKVNYVIGQGPGMNRDAMRLKYDVENMKKISEESGKEEPPKVDEALVQAKKELSSALAGAQKKLDGGTYTESSKARLVAAMESAKAMAEESDVDKIRRAVGDLYAAMDQLVEKIPAPTPDPKPTPNPKPTPDPDVRSWERPRHDYAKTEIKTNGANKAEKKETFTVKAPSVAYVKGFPDGSFKPDQGVTRAEVSQILSQFIQTDRAYRLPGDVDAGAWYANSVARLYALSILNGYEDGNIRPQSTMTRAELATIMTRILNLPMENARFNDVDARAWYSGYAGAVQQTGMMKGYPDGTFGGDRTVTRAELVAIVNRAFGVAEKKGATAFKDVPASHWAYKDIQKAAN